jgi:hypothetical protein
MGVYWYVTNNTRNICIFVGKDGEWNFEDVINNNNWNINDEIYAYNDSTSGRDYPEGSLWEPNRFWNWNNNTGYELLTPEQVIMRSQNLVDDKEINIIIYEMSPGAIKTFNCFSDAYVSIQCDLHSKFISNTTIIVFGLIREEWVEDTQYQLMIQYYDLKEDIAKDKHRPQWLVEWIKPLRPNIGNIEDAINSDEPIEHSSLDSGLYDGEDDNNEGEGDCVKVVRTAEQTIQFKDQLDCELDAYIIKMKNEINN